MKLPTTLPKSNEDAVKLTNEQELRINRQVTQIVLHHPFFASLILTLRRTPTYRIPTMATDGVHIFWNPIFTASMEDNEIRGVLVHECLHPGLGHLWRVRPEWDTGIANMAMDYAINNFLDNYNQGIDEKLRLLLPGTGDGALKGRAPKDGEFVLCLDHKYDDMSFEHIYSLLINDPKMGKQKSGKSWRDATMPGDTPGNRERPLDGNADGSGTPQAEGDGGYTSVGEVLRPGINPNTNEETSHAEWAENMSKARQTAKVMGKLPSQIERMLDGALRPSVDWVSELSRFMDAKRTDDFSWAHPDRRFLGQGFYLPGLYSEGMGSIALIVDTSGSVDDHLLNRFASELMAISSRLRPDKMIVIYCDADVQREEIFRPGDLIQLHPKGGGGTDFRPAFDYVDKNHTDIVACAYFTDGWGTHRSTPPNYPVLWLDYGKSDYPYGDVVRVTV